MITADLLKRITLFAPVPEHERASIAARAADVRLDPGEWLLMEGQAPAFYGLLDGTIDVYKWVGGRELKLISYGPGDYFGEVPLMLGAPALASLKATEPSRLMRLERGDFLDLVTHCRILNGEISKTMMDRVGRLNQVTFDNPAASTKVIGHRLDPASYDLREFLSRNRIPFEWDNEGPDGPMSDGRFTPPVIELADGRRLESPSFRELADALGLATRPQHDAYDVVIVGGGPAGLAAAVYRSSEGLSTLLVERTALRGQAGKRSRA